MTRALSTVWLGAAAEWTYQGETIEDLHVLGHVLKLMRNALDIVQGEEGVELFYASEASPASSLKERRIALSPAWLMEPPAGMTFADGVDILFAQALHEAAHCRYTDTAAAHPHLSGLELPIYHMIEDMYVEKRTVLQFPGYRPFFAKRNALLYQNAKRETGSGIPSRILNQFLYALHQTELDDRLDPLIEDMACEVVMLIDDALENRVELNRLELAQKVAHTLFPTPAPGEAPSLMIEFEAEADGEHAASSFDGSGLSGIVHTQHLNAMHQEYKAGSLSNWGARLIQRQVEEAKQTIERMSGEEADDSCYVTVPVIDAAVHARYIQSLERIAPYITWLRQRLIWLESLQERKEYGLRTGEIYEPDLYLAPYDPRFFCRAEEAASRPIQWSLYLLVDESFSTRQPCASDSVLTRSDLSLDLTMVFVHALADLSNIRVTALGYSTRPGTGVLEISELYTDEHREKERLAALTPKEATPEYSALAYVHARAQTDESAAERRAYIVLSDGTPDDYRFVTPHEHREKIKAQVEQIKREGDLCIHLALAFDSGLDDVYPLHVPYVPDHKEMLKQCSRLLASLLPTYN